MGKRAVAEVEGHHQWVADHRHTPTGAAWAEAEAATPVVREAATTMDITIIPMAVITVVAEAATRPVTMVVVAAATSTGRAAIDTCPQGHVAPWAPKIITDILEVGVTV